MLHRAIGYSDEAPVHNTTVTESEAAHGHRITYSFDTLERDAKQAGLKILVKRGYFSRLAVFNGTRF